MTSIGSENRQLIAAVLDGTASADDWQQLDDLLRRDAAVRRYYIEQSRLHGMMLWRAGQDQSPVAMSGSRRTPSIARAWALAAMVVLGIGLAMSLLLTHAWNRHERLTSPVKYFATIIDARNAVFDRSDIPTAPGSQLPGGFLRLEAGEVDIEFFSGARVTVKGPAEFGVNSHARGFLAHGEARVYCPPQASGFSIGAPGFTVIDLGTRFDLRVRPDGDGDLRVIEGRVRLELPGGRTTELALDDSVRVTRGALASLPAAAWDEAPPLPVVPMAVESGYWMDERTWADGQVPRAGVDYHVGAGQTLRTTINSQLAYFRGESLTLAAGGTLLTKNKAAAVAPLIRLQGGHITHGGNTGESRDVSVESHVEVAGSGTIDAQGRMLIIDGQVSGRGTLAITGSQRGQVILKSNTSGFEGRWVVSGATLTLDTVNVLGGRELRLTDGARMNIAAWVDAPGVSLRIDSGATLTLSARAVFKEVFVDDQKLLPGEYGSEELQTRFPQAIVAEGGTLRIGS